MGGGGKKPCYPPMSKHGGIHTPPPPGFTPLTVVDNLAVVIEWLFSGYIHDCVGVTRHGYITLGGCRMVVIILILGCVS